MFEKMVGEPDCVLYFKTPEKLCITRCLDHAKNSGVVGVTKAIITKRFNSFIDSSKPIIDFYALKGRMREVDGSDPPDDVWKLTQAAKIHRISGMA